MGTKPLRVGVLCDSLRFAAWQMECLQRVHATDGIEIALFIINDEPPAPRRSFAQKLQRNLTNGLLLWRIYERLVLAKAESTKPVDLPDNLADLPQLRVEPLKVGRFRQAFDPSTIGRLRGYDLDVLVRFGFGILTGDVLDTARYGIWSYHHGDPKEFRGAPPGFWEIHNGSPVTGVVLQRLTESLDGGVILRSGRFKTINTSYRRSLDRIFFGASSFIAASLKGLCRNPESFANATALQESGPIYRYPRNGAMLRFLVKSWERKLRDPLISMVRHQQWAIGLIEMPVERLFEYAARKEALPSPRWLPERKSRFLADPMIFGTDGSLTLLAEEFDWRTGVGHITRVEDVDGGAATADVIRTPHHLSYPYLVEHDGELYCIPESAESGRVTLYRLDRGTGAWAEDKVLIDGFPAVDPTLFEHEGRWWLLCTDAEAGANEVLHAWTSDGLLGEWTPHAANPIKIDVASTRPAGPPFRHDGHLIRPAQDCSRQYGGALVFNRILKLSPEEFVEEPVARLEPDLNGAYPAGLHTICGAGGTTVIDGARYTFFASEMRRAIARKLRLGKRR